MYGILWYWGNVGLAPLRFIIQLISRNSMRSDQFDRLEFGYYTGRINRRDFIKKASVMGALTTWTVTCQYEEKEHDPKLTPCDLWAKTRWLEARPQFQGSPADPLWEA